MSDLEWQRPMPDGAWVNVNTPQPGDVLIQRWDPTATPPGIVVRLSRRQAFVYNLRGRLRRLWERIARHD